MFSYLIKRQRKRADEKKKEEEMLKGIFIEKYICLVQINNKKYEKITSKLSEVEKHYPIFYNSTAKFKIVNLINGCKTNPTNLNSCTIYFLRVK
jgi:hypothetical protein